MLGLTKTSSEGLVRCPSELEQLEDKRLRSSWLRGLVAFKPLSFGAPIGSPITIPNDQFLDEKAV